MGDVLVVSSTTRPTGVDLYAGRWIYEADTGRSLLYDGTGWIIMDEPPQTWSNPITGVTGGTPSWSGFYRRSGGYCDLHGRHTLGGAPSAYAPSVTLPFTATQVRLGQLSVAWTDNGVANYVGVADRGTTACVLYVLNTSATYGGVTTPSTTIPFTWGSTDFLEVAGRYEMASRYS